jgi:ribosomal-protein-alanine N-acetyltransferase
MITRLVGWLSSTSSRRGKSGAIMLTIEPGTEIGMRSHPTLQTERLVLREFELEDAPDVRRLAGEPEIARMTLLIPHPYEEGMAEAWISSQRPAYEAGEHVNFAVTLRGEGTLVGSITLGLNPRDDNGELGYWIGVPYWGRGYCTEAAREVVRYGFEDLGLHRIHASHFGSNPASGRVMQKIGMSYEGTRREHYKKWGEYEDRVDYGLLAGEYLDATSLPRRK